MILWSYIYQRHRQILKVFHFPRPRNNRPTNLLVKKKKRANMFLGPGVQGQFEVWKQVLTHQMPPPT